MTAMTNYTMHFSDFHDEQENILSIVHEAGGHVEIQPYEVVIRVPANSHYKDYSYLYFSSGKYLDLSDGENGDHRQIIKDYDVITEEAKNILRTELCTIYPDNVVRFSPDAKFELDKIKFSSSRNKHFQLQVTNGKLDIIQSVPKKVLVTKPCMGYLVGTVIDPGRDDGDGWYTPSNAFWRLPKDCCIPILENDTKVKLRYGSGEGKIKGYHYSNKEGLHYWILFSNMEYPMTYHADRVEAL
jgi:hypothetical protein